MILNEWKRKLSHLIACGSGSGSGSCFISLDVEAEAVDKKKSLLEAEAEAIGKKISIFKWKRKRLKFFLLKWKRKLWKFFLQNWSGSAIKIYRFQNTVAYRQTCIRRKVRSRGICVSAMAKNVISHILYFNIFSNFLFKCYSISIIIIDFA